MQSEENKVTGSLKDILTLDLNLKGEIVSMYKKVLDRQTLQIVMIGVIAVIVIIFSIAFYTKPTHIDTKVLEGLRQVTSELGVEKSAIHTERLQLKAQRQELEEFVAQEKQSNANNKSMPKMDSVILMLKRQEVLLLKQQQNRNTDSINKK